MYSSDAAFFIGKTHKVCQDYALADCGASVAFPSVWLCDGCSSSPNTDIGARLLAHVMREQGEGFRDVHAAETPSARQSALDDLVCANFTRAAGCAASLGVAKACVDATLLGLVAVPADDSVYAVLYGDGAVVFGLTDGTREIYRSRYPAGYPYYPAYVEDPGRRAMWQEVADNAHRIEQTTLAADGGVTAVCEFTPAEPFHLLRRPRAGLRFAAVLSDGIESYQARVGAETSSRFQGVPCLEAVRELTAFKNFKGEFVHRRMQAFGKDGAKRGWHHNDDISVAALHFEET